MKEKKFSYLDVLIIIVLGGILNATVQQYFFSIPEYTKPKGCQDELAVNEYKLQECQEELATVYAYFDTTLEDAEVEDCGGEPCPEN